jgi:ATP-dependent DNA helicase RecG
MRADADWRASESSVAGTYLFCYNILIKRRHMNEENIYWDKKSLRVLQKKNPDWNELAKDCVAFANARGGKIFIGVEDGNDEPDGGQKVDGNFPEKIRKRMAELTINVGTRVAAKTWRNGGEYIEIEIFSNPSTIASTTDGRYYIRISDKTIPVLPDELSRLFTDKSAYVWEVAKTEALRSDIDSDKAKRFLDGIRNSNRVKPFVKLKSDAEIFEHYLLTDKGTLTNLGVLWIGKQSDGAKLLYAPTLQFLKYDADGNKVNKIVWDDFSLNPQEIAHAVLTQIPDWREGIEISHGLFRKFIPDYEEEVIRELIANALVHRPYTTRGDIFINLYPDRVEFHNPGLFPIGVTSKNILHKSVRRNEHLARVFHDLKLMEREGSGYDKIYEKLLSNGKAVPVVCEQDDRVVVTVKKQILKSDSVELLTYVIDQYGLRDKQKEIICLGLIAQNMTMTALELTTALDIKGEDVLSSWMGGLIESGIIQSKGKTKGKQYFVNPDLLRKTRFKGKTNLKNIEPHRLKELIFEDLRLYPGSAISDIHQRIGTEIPMRQLRNALYTLTENHEIQYVGDRKWRRYSL